MAETWSVASVADLADAVMAALAEEKSVELVGRGSRRGLGRPVAADVILDLSKLTGIASYAPDELVLTVLPGTPLDELQAVLGERGQHLAFEPTEPGLIWADVGGSGSIGGAVLTASNGSRRLAAGGARDYVLGVKGVNGFGDAFAAGGRVVKNVTGFDLSKLVTGSFGTLCAVSELTLKVLPEPQDVATVVVAGLDVAAALDAMRRAINLSRAPVSAAAHLPAEIAFRSAVAAIAMPGESVTMLRVEGVASAVAAQVRELAGFIAQQAGSIILDRADSRRAWREAGSAGYFSGNATQLWHLSVPPARGADVIRALPADLPAAHYFDWAGGGIWLEVPPADDAHASTVRAALAAAVGNDGHATLLRADAAVRASVAPFQPPSAAVALLTERVRRQFDPQGIFNPGRMYARETCRPD